MKWSPVPLGELLSSVSREEDVAADRQYDILGAHWYAKGLYTKESKYGSEIAASKVYRVEIGDFVYNRLFAWKGSFSLATEENHACYVSNEFPCFAVNKDRLEPRFLLYYFSQETAWTEALGLSSGGTPTSRNRLKEGMLLRMTIPLPPLPEQQRIVAKIEELTTKVTVARGIRDKCSAEAEAFLRSGMRRAFDQRGHCEVAALQSVCSSIVDCLHSNPVYSDEGVPTVRSPDVGWRTLNLAGARRTSEAEYQRRTRRAEPLPDDIILVREGGGTGKAGMVQEGDRCSLGQRVMMLRRPRKGLAEVSAVPMAITSHPGGATCSDDKGLRLPTPKHQVCAAF